MKYKSTKRIRTGSYKYVSKYKKKLSLHFFKSLCLFKAKKLQHYIVGNLMYMNIKYIKTTAQKTGG